MITNVLESEEWATALVKRIKSGSPGITYEQLKAIFDADGPGARTLMRSYYGGLTPEQAFYELIKDHGRQIIGLPP